MQFKQRRQGLNITLTFHKWWSVLFVLTFDFWADYNSQITGYFSTNAYIYPGNSLTKSSVTDAEDNYTITVQGENVSS